MSLCLFKGVYSKNDKHMSIVRCHCTIESRITGSLDRRLQEHNIQRLQEDRNKIESVGEVYGGGVKHTVLFKLTLKCFPLMEAQGISDL